MSPHIHTDKKWIVLLAAVYGMIVIQIVILIVLVMQRGTSGSPSLIAGQPMASLPSGTPSELLLKYTEQGETSYVESVLKQNPTLDINRPRAAGNKTALYVACQNGYLDIVRLLLKQKADATICCDNNVMIGQRGYSPLTIAACNGHIEVVKTLVSFGVDIESRDLRDRTALYSAVVNNQPAMVQFLCKSKARVNITFSEYKCTALTEAAKNGYVDVVNALVKYGDKLDLEMRDGASQHTPLYYAALRGHSEVVNILCKAGADVNACQGAYSGILKDATHPEVIKILKKYGAK